VIIDKMKKRKEKRLLKKIREDFYEGHSSIFHYCDYLTYVKKNKKKNRKIYYLDEFIEFLKFQGTQKQGLQASDTCTVIKELYDLKLTYYVDDLLNWMILNRFDWILGDRCVSLSFRLGSKYLKKVEAHAWESGNILAYMKTYSWFKDNYYEELCKEMIQRIHSKTYYPSEKEIYHFYKNDFDENYIYYVRPHLPVKDFDRFLFEAGSPMQNLNYWKHCHASEDWLPLEDYLCETKDVDTLLELLNVCKESNPYRIGNIILKYGTVSQISSFVRDYPGILRSEDVVEKLKQTEHGSDLIPSLSKIEEDFEGRKELEERIFQESDPDQLVEYLCSLNVLNRVQGEDYLLETKSQDDIARYFGDYHDLVRQEQKFLDYLTTIHNRNTLQDAFHFLEYKPDRKKGLSYLEAFLRVRNIDGILTIWREIKETGETLYECLIKQGWLDLEEVKDLLLITSNQEHHSLLKSVKGEYQGPVKNLAEKVDQMALDEDYVTDVDSEFMSPEEQLWLVNLSLTRENVLPSAVRNHKEVKENIELYLELLKKCDERKYMYYQKAFAGTRTFEIADHAYQHYLKNQEEKDSKINLEKMLTYTKLK